MEKQFDLHWTSFSCNVLRSDSKRELTQVWGVWRAWGTLHLEHNCKLICEPCNRFTEQGPTQKYTPSFKNQSWIQKSTPLRVVLDPNPPTLHAFWGLITLIAVPRSVQRLWYYFEIFWNPQKLEDLKHNKIFHVLKRSLWINLFKYGFAKPPGGAPFIKIENHMRLQQTLKTPYIQFFFFCKVKQYMYNLNDKTTSVNMYT